MNKENLAFVIYYAACTLLMLIWSIVQMRMAWKRKNTDDFTANLSVLFISVTPFSMVIVTIYLIFIPFIIIGDWFNNCLEEKFRR